MIAVFASLHETGAEKPVCEKPKTPFPHDECGWDYIDDTSGKLHNNTRVEKTRADEISVIRELGVWEVVDRPRDEVVFGTRWVDINKGDETPSRLVLICATIEELTNDAGQPVAWIGPVGVCVASCGSLHGQEQS